MKKIRSDPSYRFREKRILIPKNDVTELKISLELTLTCLRFNW